MGGGSWSDDAYRHITSSYAGKSTAKVFTSTSVSVDMSPKGVTFRESRDSDEHPETLAVKIGLDETGSMGRIPEIIAREKMAALMPTLIKHGVPHPQVLFEGIGDHISDQAPLQVGQFESDTKLLDKWLTGLYLEGNGGGQQMESYLLSWLFGARHCSIDCFEKRGAKGFLFTIGDEWTHETLSPDHVEKIMGYRPAEPLTAKGLLAEASRMWHVFHIHANDGSYRNDRKILDPWRALLGERLIVVDDHTTIIETIATTIAVVHGADLKAVTAGFDSKTALAVTSAVSNVAGAVATVNKSGAGGIVKL